MKNIVLVMVALWMALAGEGVYKILKRDGLQRQHRPESDDIVGGRRSSYQANSCSAGRTYNFSLAIPYGGAVITEAGNHPKVFRPSYTFAAFAPDKGRVGGIAYKGPAARRARTADTTAARRLFGFSTRRSFPASFAADVEPEKSRVYG